MANETEESSESNPSFAEILEKGYPPEWIPLMAVSSIILMTIIVLDLKVVRDHKKYSIQHTLQFICTIGILQIYPLYCVMYLSGMIVPKTLSTVTYIAETYEAISYLFFLRLMLTYMGGKKITKEALKGEKAHLNVPPLCCLFCLPHITFTRTLFVIYELFIAQFVIFQLVFGFVEMMMSLDGSTDHPTDLVEEDYAKFYHATLIVSLLISIYGLSGIYHTAEKELEHRNIFKKFITYKMLLILVKAQDIFIQLMSKYDGFGDISSGAFSSTLRAHLWSSMLVMVECMVFFLFAVHYYNIEDYPTCKKGSPLKLPVEASSKAGDESDSSASKSESQKEDSVEVVVDSNSLEDPAEHV